MSRRKPAARCVGCDRSIEETAGARLVATPHYSIRFCTIQTPLGSLRHPATTVRLTEKYRDVIVVMAGTGLWTAEVIERVVEVGMSGLRPWVCQTCAHNHLCRECESPLTTVPMSDYLEDNGQSVHASFMSGFGQNCPNPNCSKHHPPRDKEN